MTSRKQALIFPSYDPPLFPSNLMASYIVGSSQILSGTTGADSVWVQSGGAGSSQIFALDGNDTITVESVNNNSAAGLVARGAGGADSIHVDSGTFSAGGTKLYGGSGNDTITISGGGTYSVINTNEDNDLINAVGSATISAISFSTGSDTLVLSGTVGTVGMGNGHDEFSGTVVSVTSASTIKLGDGRDTIEVASLLGASGASAITIQGDTDTNFGADSINLGVTDITGLVVKGQGGSDTITVSGASVSSLIQGNDGHDVVTVLDFSGDTTIGGGKGRDTIDLDAFVANSGDIFGGNDADSIFIRSGIAQGTDASTMTIAGGAGADTITISGAADVLTGSYGTLQFSAASESNLSAIDLFQIVSGTTSGAAANLSGGVTLNVDFNGAANISAISTGYGVARAGNATSYVVTDASGIATFEGDLSGTVNSSVTAAVEAIDKSVITKGDGALFTIAGGAEYLFIQGGTAGTSDDYVVAFNGLSASMLSDAGSAFTVTFSGTDS